jgi:endonuclease YncB( thermonuclease family)
VSFLTCLRWVTSLLLLVSLLVPPTVHGQAPRVLTGTVVKVIDGDTIHVRIGKQDESVTSA